MPIENETVGRGYELPAPPNLLSEDVLRLIAAITKIDADVSTVILSLGSKADTAHVHVIGDVSGLAAALADKAPLVHNHALGTLVGVSISGAAEGQVLVFSGGQWVNGALSIGAIPGLAATLASLQAQIDDIDGGTF